VPMSIIWMNKEVVATYFKTLLQLSSGNEENDKKLMIGVKDIRAEINFGALRSYHYKTKNVFS
jgi:hypothetical protein